MLFQLAVAQRAPSPTVRTRTRGACRCCGPCREAIAARKMSAPQIAEALRRACERCVKLQRPRAVTVVPCEIHDLSKGCEIVLQGLYHRSLDGFVVLDAGAALLGEYWYCCQPVGDLGIEAMNGPAVWPWPLLATAVRAPSDAGTLPMWALWIETAEARARESAWALAMRARTWPSAAGQWIAALTDAAAPQCREVCRNDKVSERNKFSAERTPEPGHR